VQALEGVAGAGKTTALRPFVTQRSEKATVQGFAPTSRAAQKLAEAGIPTRTPVSPTRHEGTNSGRIASTCSTNRAWRAPHRCTSSAAPHQTIALLLVGDVRQHEAVDAGRPTAQAQASPPRLDQVVRQRTRHSRQWSSSSRGATYATIEQLDAGPRA
jgi:hypothetical protein